MKPDFWTDGTITQLSFEARLFYIGTWNFALCDAGHLPDDPEGLRLKILPADDVDPFALVAELLGKGRLKRVAVGDRTFLWIPRLSDHQKVDGRWNPRCPACSAGRDAVRDVPQECGEAPRTSPELPEAPRNSTDHTVVKEGKGKERKGEGQELPRLVVDEPASSIASLPRQDEIVLAEIVETSNTLALVDDLNAGQIVAQWIDYCTANGVKLPQRLIGQYAKGIKTALDEKFPPNLIKVALAGMLTDRCTDKPSVLANRLVRAQTGPERRPQRMTPGETVLARYVEQDPAVADVLASWYPGAAA